MNKDTILNSITILSSGPEVSDSMKEELSNSGKDLSPLQDVTIIAIENTLHGGKLQDLNGITMAIAMLTINPQIRIILYSPIELPQLRNLNPKIDILLVKPNVCVLETPCGIDTLISAFSNKAITVESKDAATALTTHVKSILTGIFHDIRKAKNPLLPEGDFETEKVASGFAQAKSAFPMLNGKDNASILNFLENVASDREEVRKGERLAGTFCDMEGTLFSDGILNEAVLAVLKQHESDGKEITLWTDGNIAALQNLLDANNIDYALKAKREYAGAIVETAIDDMDENAFIALTKIYAESFIRACDIAA